MSLKHEFVLLAAQEGANMSTLCRRFGISRPTGYKWLRRYQQGGVAALEECSRRPFHSPAKTPKRIAEAVLSVRKQHPAWGGRKIRTVLQRQARDGQCAFTTEEVPAASTCQAILKRNGLIDKDQADKHTPFRRFEKEAPNELWQMDFKGHFALTESTERCHPFAVIDDHSRFALCLAACADEQAETVQEHLVATFRRYGMPQRILCDNGGPWGWHTPACHGVRGWSTLGVWLLRLGVAVSHGRARHPETQGKQERFHRSLQAEVIRFEDFEDLPACQRRFRQWRSTYNNERPHEALNMDVPASRYEIAPRCFPEQLPPIEYSASDHVRKVQHGGWIWFKGERFRVGGGFHGQPVALRPTVEDGKWEVFFCHQKIKTIDMREPDSKR